MPDDLSSWIIRSPAFPARIFRFAAVGGATSAGYFIFVAAMVHAEFAEGFAAALAYLVFLPLNYIGHRRLTWRSKVPKSLEVLRFLGVHGITMLTCMTIMVFTIEVLYLSYWIGSLLIVVIAPLLNLSMFNIWVFRRP